MLILTRRPGEGFRIRDDIKITIVEVKGKQVRVGISTPQGFPVYREEIYGLVVNQNKLALENRQENVEDSLKVLKKEKVIKDED